MDGAKDCQELQEDGVTESGEYWVRPGGYGTTPMRVHCNMKDHQGGWTQVYKLQAECGTCLRSRLLSYYLSSIPIREPKHASFKAGTHYLYGQALKFSDNS